MHLIHPIPKGIIKHKLKMFEKMNRILWVHNKKVGIPIVCRYKSVLKIIMIINHILDSIIIYKFKFNGTHE